MLVILFIMLVCFFLLLKTKKDFFTNSCLGKRDGVSGCRDCCSKYNDSNLYSSCVRNCMNY